jgi:hypothetical protein
MTKQRHSLQKSSILDCLLVGGIVGAIWGYMYGREGAARLLNIGGNRTTGDPHAVPRKVRELALEKQLGSFLLKNVNLFPMRCVEYLFDEGMIQVRNFSPFRSLQPLFYWKDVILFKTTAKTVLYWASAGDRYVSNRFVRRLRLEFADGRVWKVNLRGHRILTEWRYFRQEGAQEHERSHELQAAIQIEDKIAHAQIERVREALEAGGTVQFGRISATLNGIAWDEHILSWEQVTGIGKQTYRGRGDLVWIFSTNGVYYTLPAAEVDNRPTLGLLWEIMHPEVPDARSTGSEIG